MDIPLLPIFHSHLVEVDEEVNVKFFILLLTLRVHNRERSKQQTRIPKEGKKNRNRQKAQLFSSLKQEE